MRYLGLITTLTLTVLGISIYSLSFTLITRKIDNQANKHAMDTHGGINFEKRIVFLKEQENKIIYKIPGTGINYTYQQAKEKSLSLGLDLQGGMHMVLRIDMPALLTKLAGRNSRYANFIKALQLTKEESPDTVDSFITKFIANYTKLSPKPIHKLFIHTDIQNKTSSKPTQQETIQAIKQYYKEAVQANVKIYTNRLNKLGTSSINITITPRQDIEIDAPGYGHANQERLKNIIETPGQLAIYSIKSLDETQQKQIIQQLHKKARKAKKQANTPTILDILSSTPEGYMICKKEHEPIITKHLQSDSVKLLLPDNLTPIISNKPHKRGDDNEYYSIHFAQTENPILQGNEIKSAETGFIQGEYAVHLTTNNLGAKKLRKYTANNTGSTIMIAFDNKAYCIPVVQNEIPNGKFQISGGNMSEQQATDLANISTSGAVSPTETLEKTIIGPTLSNQAQNQGINAVILALILIILFMAIYYGGGGIIASLALLANAIIILSILAQIKAALTLPGIAGLIVSLGTGIDGNVIINEAISDQLQQGKTLKNAIINGYNKSYSSIIDSNITTLLASLVLYIWGQGAIKGFATTLTIGTISSCFTSVLVSRIITEGAIRLIGVEKLSFSFLKKYTNHV